MGLRGQIEVLCSDWECSLAEMYLEACMAAVAQVMQFATNWPITNQHDLIPSQAAIVILPER